jgi:hypothetical protein
MTSSGCSAGWLACTNSAAKLRNASSTYARRPLSACSQRIFNPHFGLRLGLISHLELVCSGQRRHLQLYDNCAVADDQWYWQGRFSTMQSITQRTILAIFLQVNPPVGNLRHAVKPLLAWLRKAVPTPKPWHTVRHRPVCARRPRNTVAGR